jgi:hypothetical protein
MAKQDVADETTTEVATRLNVEQLRGISSFEDALSIANDTYGVITQASEELGDGFALVKDEAKTSLVGVELIVMSWTFSEGDFSHELCTMRIVTKDGRKLIVNDGSTGIADQLRAYQDRTGHVGGLYVKRGFRVSTYDYTDEQTGKTSKASTYYLDTSA